MLDEITKIVGHLRPIGRAAYLYGSQVGNQDPTKDVDMLFVLQDVNKEEFIRKMKLVQANSKYLLHPVFVSEEIFDRNPYFSVLIEDGIRLW